MSCELFVGNLNPDVRARDLENLFSRYGKIIRCDLKKNYAFVEIGDKQDGDEAIRKENNRRLLGSVMTVEWAKGSFGQKPSLARGRSPPRKPRSPPPSRFADRSRNRSPLDVGRAPRRDRSPMGRGGPPRSIGMRDDKFGGDRYRDAAPRSDRSGDRYASRDSYQDRGSARGPPPSRGDRGRDEYNDRRASGGGSRRF